ncbi:hypothetical protein BD410DRAFT_783410 [Rickenella mellea]|uniref:Uncharacterized protein n=1 Tax=Rickenella mellea TaxID=50990 RepID=A0A4Y7QG34_9AGAM|nr:hypothetical protein BD410DRAFT_783410 [Rickenella mellea]
MYYAALNATIQDAKSTLGQELTIWRDAVGTAESDKERKAQRVKADDEGDDNEDEADE